jgi:hypothetical protein
VRPRPIPVRCEGTRRDGSSCGALARPGSTLCWHHETGLGPGLFAIESGRSPYDTKAPGPERPGNLFDEAELEGAAAPHGCPCASGLGGRTARLVEIERGGAR